MLNVGMAPRLRAVTREGKVKSNCSRSYASTTVSLGMAEVILNAAWLVVSIAALVWLLHSRSSQKLTFSQAIIAFACVSMLLFPVVSASDDAFAAQPAAEDTSVIKKLTHSTTDRSIVLSSSGVASLASSSYDLGVNWYVAEMVAADGRVIAASSSVAGNSNRAPPLVQFA
jgi:hypothetical protein